MSNLRTLALAGTILAGLAAPLAAQDADTVVATVNGTDITLGHMIALQNRLPEQYKQLPDQVLYDGILQQLIQQTALEQAAGEPDKRATLTLENERRALLAGEMIQQAADEPVTDEELQEAYKAAYADAAPETEWHASHILVKTEDEAKELVTALEGGKDFAELAKEKSTGPTGPNGGDLGWFSEGMMVKEFEDAVKTLKPGEISGPVQTQFGWHVLKLQETRQKEAPTLDEVRDELTDTVRQNKITAMVEKITSEATITQAEPGTVDPAMMRDESLLDK
ncbi:peptidylprolyl isomerase [Oceaniglobus roseus]|uniref:peptidylprolyl isomerase n=1 Tax=Oceaniglobus roseus TaxID=1737570 RepID=UPI000C7E9BBA|nr:peptidylprolyl isomerase [Kandeliimicrobium roseum]